MLLIEESKNVFLGKIKVRSYLMNIRPGDFQIPVLWKSSTVYSVCASKSRWTAAWLRCVGVFPQDRCWCCSTEEGALVRSSGNAIALSWEEMIGEMELLLGAGRCYLTAMKCWSAHREALVSQLGADSGREEGEAIQLNWRCRTAFASRVTSWAVIKGAALGKQGHLISFACCQGHVI